MTTSETSSFRAESFTLLDRCGSGASLSLRPISAPEAQGLGAAFAALEPWSRYPFSATMLAQYLSGEEAGAPRYVVSTPAGSAGALGLRLNWLRGPYIQFLGILPEQQRRGIGAQLLSWTAERARAQGARNLWVAASAFNSAALAFYERHDFERVALLEGLVQDGIDEVLLRKRIA